VLDGKCRGIAHKEAHDEQLLASRWMEKMKQHPC
jgi:hypothetical protein